MAKATMKMPYDFLMQLSKLGNQTDVIIPKVLEAGGEVVVSKVKSNLQSVIGKNTKEDSRSTGELASALGVTTAKQDRNGDFNVKVGFAEPRQKQRQQVDVGKSKATSNAMLANTIEYGKHGQPAKPFLKPAKSATKNTCISAMKAKFEEEVEKI